VTIGRDLPGRPAGRAYGAPGNDEVWSTVRRTLLAFVVQAAVVASLLAGTTAFVALDKTVTLSVDGERHEVRSFGRTVGAVLEAEGIVVGDRDLVTPTPDQSIGDGDTVVIRYGRPVVLSVDGRRSTVWTTARSVDEALMMFGLRSEGAFVSVSRSTRIKRGGMTLDVRLPHHMTVLVDGKRKDLTTTAFTVRDALAEAGVRLRSRDRVSPDLGTRPVDEQVIAVTRVDGRRAVVETPIPFKTVRTESDDLYEGETEVQRAGQVGLKVRVFRETYVDGKRTKRTLLRQRVAEKPVDQVVLVGTKEKPPEPTNSPSADGLNWAALADCESGGNPNAYNSAGPYYGLYQFSEPTWRSVGGSGLPTDYGYAEQTYRAQLLYQRSGAGQWPVCGRYLFS
jgi:uncharacterized protein YabE (DUF348 family)